jgi:hypothetical protein
VNDELERIWKKLWPSIGTYPVMLSGEAEEIHQMSQSRLRDCVSAGVLIRRGSNTVQNCWSSSWLVV